MDLMHALALVVLVLAVLGIVYTIGYTVMSRHRATSRLKARFDALPREQREP